MPQTLNGMLLASNVMNVKCFWTKIVPVSSEMERHIVRRIISGKETIFFWLLFMNSYQKKIFLLTSQIFEYPVLYIQIPKSLHWWILNIENKREIMPTLWSNYFLSWFIGIISYDLYLFYRNKVLPIFMQNCMICYQESSYRFVEIANIFPRNGNSMSNWDLFCY